MNERNGIKVHKLQKKNTHKNMKVEKVKLFVEIGILAAAAAHKRGPLIIMGDFQKCRKKAIKRIFPQI